MLSTSSIIDNIKKDKFLNYKKLCKHLKISKKNDKEKLLIALNALEKLEIIRKNEHDEFENIKDEQHITAKIRCSSKGYCFAVRDNSNEDIYIKENLLNYAWNGDKVLVRVIKEGIRRRSPEGIVDCILDRENKILLAKVEQINENLYGIPIDDRILAKIKLPSNDKKYIYDLKQKNIVKIEIDMFPIGQEEGKGHVIEELILNNIEENDNKFVLSKNNIKLNEQKVNLVINKLENEERLDLTSNNSFMFKSWGNKNCPLLPLFQVQSQKDKTFKLWIHVNAIAERIDFNNKTIDEFFEDNYESFPLINNWNNFLDTNLLNVSDFKLGTKNNALSLCITLSKNKEIIDWSFHLTSVKCSAIIDNKYFQAINKRRSKLTSKILLPIEKYIDEIKLIIDISKKFRNNQIKKGKYEISKEINKIESLNEFYFHKPAQYTNDFLEPLNQFDPQTIISPLLFEADSIWYLHSQKYNIDNISYKSNNLDYLNINDLIKHSQLIDENLELDEEGNLSLDSLFNSSNDDIKERIINKYLINNARINEAKLSQMEETDKRSIFSHAPWTLPSIDYINLINQYNIFLMFKYAKQSKDSSKKVNIFEKDSWEKVNWNLFNSNNLKISNLLFENSIIEKNNAYKAKINFYLSNMISIKKMREAEKLVGKEFKGLIITVQSYGFFVEISELLVEGLVHVSTLNDDWYEYRSRQNLLIGRKQKNTFRVGDLINIKIIKVDILKYQIDLEIIN